MAKKILHKWSDFDWVWNMFYFIGGLWFGLTYIFYATPYKALISALFLTLIYLMIILLALKAQEN